MYKKAANVLSIKINWKGGHYPIHDFDFVGQSVGSSVEYDYVRNLLPIVERSSSISQINA